MYYLTNFLAFSSRKRPYDIYGHCISETAFVGVVSVLYDIVTACYGAFSVNVLTCSLCLVDPVKQCDHLVGWGVGWGVGWRASWPLCFYLVYGFLVYCISKQSETIRLSRVPFTWFLNWCNLYFRWQAGPIETRDFVHRRQYPDSIILYPL